MAFSEGGEGVAMIAKGNGDGLLMHLGEPGSVLIVDPSFSSQAVAEQVLTPSKIPFRIIAEMGSLIDDLEKSRTNPPLFVVSISEAGELGGLVEVFRRPERTAYVVIVSQQGESGGSLADLLARHGAADEHPERSDAVR